jgi:hypothetical protein
MGVTGNMFSGGCEIKGSEGDYEPPVVDEVKVVVVVVVKMKRKNMR